MTVQREPDSLRIEISRPGAASTMIVVTGGEPSAILAALMSERQPG